MKIDWQVAKEALKPPAVVLACLVALVISLYGLTLVSARAAGWIIGVFFVTVVVSVPVLMIRADYKRILAEKKDETNE